MKLGTKHRQRFDRVDRVKGALLARVLRLRESDFRRDRPVVSIIGDLVSDYIRATGLFERDNLESLRDCVLDLAACREMIAIDVGANIGNHSMFLSDLFAKVIAFEPNPLARSLFEINLTLNGIANVEVYPVALSDHVGREMLSFDQGNIGGARLGSQVAGSKEPDARTQVELAIGDELINRAEPIGFIKVDVEGAEEPALRGLEQTIRRHEPIMMVEQLQDAIDPVSGTSPCFNFLCDLGYTAVVMRTHSGFLGKLVAVIRGYTTCHLERIERLEIRDYDALIFVPRGAV